MGILDGIVEWIAEQVMNLLDMINGSILGALGCDMTTFLRYFPAAETMYSIFVGLGLGLLLLNFVWQLFRNFGLGIGVEAEDPLKLTCKTILFVMIVFFAEDIVNLAMQIGGTPYQWIVDADLPPIQFASFMSVATTVVGGMVSGSVLLITLILLIILAWNYIKLLFEAAERYILLGVLVFTAPVAVALGGSQTTSNIFKSWCRMLGGQIFLLIMNAWCLKLFTNMFGEFIANPMGSGDGGNIFLWFLCAIGFLKVSQKIDSFMASLGISVGHTGGSMLGEALIVARGLGGFKPGFGGMGGGKAGGPSPTGVSPGGGLFSGGLAGMVGRKAAAGAASNLTSEGSGSGGFFSGLGGKMYESSVGEEGGFASRVIGGVATGSAVRNGVISGEKAVDAFNAYMGPMGGIPSAAANEEMEGDAGGMQPTGPATVESNIPISPDVSAAAEDVEVGAGQSDGGAELPMESDQIPMSAGGDIGMEVPEGAEQEIPYSSDASSADGYGDSGEAIGAGSYDSMEAAAAGMAPTIPTTADGGSAIAEGGGAYSEASAEASIPGGVSEIPPAPIPAGVESAGVVSDGAEGSVVTGSDSSTSIPSGGGATIPTTPGGASGATGGVQSDNFAEGVGSATFASRYAGAGASSLYSEPPTFKNIEMGSGRITGMEVSPLHPGGIQFAMYHAGQYAQPDGKFTTITSRDGEKWYKQYAMPAVERTPVREEKGKVICEEKIVQKLPKAPPRRDR